VVREVREGDLAGMVCVLEQCFGKWPPEGVLVDAIDHLRWKMASHAEAARFQVVAEVGGAVAGRTCASSPRCGSSGDRDGGRNPEQGCSIHPRA
jgi:hypothetical protein